FNIEQPAARHAARSLRPISRPGAALDGVLLLLALVASQSSEAEQDACLIMERCQDDARPIGRAVLTHPRAFGLAAPCGRCRVKVALRYAQLDVLRGIETGEMLPHDFLRAVAVDRSEEHTSELQS